MLLGELHEREEPVEVDGLLERERDAFAKGALGDARVGMGGDEDHRHVADASILLEHLGELDAVDVGHHVVGDDEPDRGSLEDVERLERVPRGVHAVAMLLEEAAEHRAQREIVIDYQDVHGGAQATNGAAALTTQSPVPKCLRVRPGRQPKPEVENLLNAAAAALDEGRLEEARDAAGRALEKDPREVHALLLRGEALLGLEKIEEAEKDFRAARKEAPDAPEVALAFVEFLLVIGEGEPPLLEEALTTASKARKRAAKEGDVEIEFEFLLLEGMIFNQLGECGAALEVLEIALKHVPKSMEVRTERALALFELCRFEQAQKALEELIAEDSEHAWAHHHLGMLAERRGETAEATRCFEKARALAPEDFLPPVSLEEGEFDGIVEDAIQRLPADVKQFLDNVTVAVEPFPLQEDLVSESPPLSPAILGVFRGVPVGERSVTSAADHATVSIVLYQRNLERFATTREELVEQIGITLMHEVGHLVGLDEDDLRERGLD